MKFEKMSATAILNGIPSDPDDPKSRFGAKGGIRPMSNLGSENARAKRDATRG